MSRTPTKSILITFEGNTTRATMLTGYTGDTRTKTAFAKCNPADEYNAFEGARIALARLFGLEPFFEEPNPEPQFEVGDIVRLNCSAENRGMVKDALGKVTYKAGNQMTPYLVKVLDEPSGRDSFIKRYSHLSDCKEVVVFPGEMRKVEEVKK
jgi:hypothetical protein